jgi:hypothetical protein
MLETMLITWLYIDKLLVSAHFCLEIVQLSTAILCDHAW